MKSPRPADRASAAPMKERHAPLDISSATFRSLGHDLVDRIADFLDGLPAGPVNRDEAPEDLRALLNADAPVPEGGAEAEQLMSSAAKLLFEHSLFNAHPRFLGYVTSPPAPIGVLAELLAAAVNANTGAWRLAPMASEIESQTIRWLGDLVGFSAGGGLFVSGGNMANIVALLAARRAAATWDVRAAGLQSEGAPRLRVLATGETHTWLQKAVDIAGLGTDAIRWVPTDEHQRMDPSALRQALDDVRGRGEVPMMVVATAGTVSTGAIDPLIEIGQQCEQAGVWMHVDGCYGGFAACVPCAPEDLTGVGRAHSVALDPHKWLYAPLEAGALLVRDGEWLRNAFAYHPPYYHFGQEATSYVDLGPQNSRGFRALKVWLALRQVGREGYVQMIGDDIRLSQWLAQRAEEHTELELCTQSLSITTFRYVPPRLPQGPQREAHLDALNKELLDRIQRSGEAFVSHAIVGGRYVLRPCIVNFRTNQEHLSRVLETVVRIGRQVDEGLRATSPWG